MFGLEDEVMNYLKMQEEKIIYFDYHFTILLITNLFRDSGQLDKWQSCIMWLVLLIFGDFCKWFMLVHK